VYLLLGDRAAKLEPQDNGANGAKFGNHATSTNGVKGMYPCGGGRLVVTKKIAMLHS
jgi:hypothetical protein